MAWLSWAAGSESPTLKVVSVSVLIRGPRMLVNINWGGLVYQRGRSGYIKSLPLRKPYVEVETTLSVISMCASIVLAGKFVMLLAFVCKAEIFSPKEPIP